MIKLASALLIVCLFSCVTINRVDQADGTSLFKGEVTHHQNGKTYSYLLDIFVHKDNPSLRIDVVSSLGFVYTSFLKKGDSYWIFFPLLRAYYILHQKELNQWFLGWILKNTSWLRLVLLDKPLKGWSCYPEMKPTHCRNQNVSVEWTGFIQKKIKIQFTPDGNQKDHASVELTKQKIDASTVASITFYSKIPSYFKKMTSLPKVDMNNLK